jgi:hypothetical protein
MPFSEVEFVVTRSSTGGLNFSVIYKDGVHQTVDPKKVEIVALAPRLFVASWIDSSQFLNKVTFLCPKLFEDFKSAMSKLPQAQATIIPLIRVW